MPLGELYRRTKGRQQGYVLLMLLLAVAMIAIMLSAAAANYARMIRRDREVEMIHRGAQYARAIRRYRMKFGQYPASLDQLEKANNMRFLRKRYKDPMTPDGQWRVLHVGEVQMGTGGVTATPTGVPGLATPSGASQPGAAGSQGSGSAFGVSTTGATGSNVFGGQIMGVSSLSAEEGIHEFNDKRAYKDWLFIYDGQERCGSPYGGCLIQGPYNPNAFYGKFGVTTQPTQGTPSQQPVAPGVPVPNPPVTNPGISPK